MIKFSPGATWGFARGSSYKNFASSLVNKHIIIVYFNYINLFL
jgi:hypothetical protein